MERVLEAERPDLVVFTGDNVNGMTSNDAYSVSIVPSMILEIRCVIVKCYCYWLVTNFLNIATVNGHHRQSSNTQNQWWSAGSHGRLSLAITTRRAISREKR
jgi:uncharacterized secreted protein with C-terminal beta-propeller domain